MTNSNAADSFEAAVCDRLSLLNSPLRHRDPFGLVAYFFANAVNFD
jgi:hypothetical protein